MNDIKMLIIVRKDLNMRTGKMIAQACHGAVNIVDSIEHGCSSSDKARLAEWKGSDYKKICVGIDGEESLRKIITVAGIAGLPTHLVTDNGLTEFNGVKTLTCGVIGPGKSEDIDRITGHLVLL